VEGRVIESAETPRSYLVETPSGQVWRNHSQLNIVSEHSSTVNLETDSNPKSVEEEPQRVVTHSHTGTAIKLPDRLC